MKKSLICFVILLIGTTIKTTAQTPNDSIKQGVRRYIARNFSEARTFNLYWQKARLMIIR